MNYFEEKLYFEEKTPSKLERSLFDSKKEKQKLGIVLRLGNSPIVKDLHKLFEYSGKTLTPDLKTLFDKKDLYIIVHMIGAIRLNGSAKVDQLQYNAEIIDVDKAQTIDLLPNTSFKELIKINLGCEGAINGNGNFSASIPTTLTQSLLDKEIGLGGDMKIQLSTNANFIGKFTYSLKFPLIQSTGIASNFCTWILNPQENPLLGDQLLIQTLAVPKGTKKITLKAKGVCKADRGLFWKQQTLETNTYDIVVNLE